MALSVLASIATDGLQAPVCPNALGTFVVTTHCVLWFGMHKAVIMKNIIFWNATPFSPVEIYGYFGESAAFILVPEHGNLEHALLRVTYILFFQYWTCCILCKTYFDTSSLIPTRSSTSPKQIHINSFASFELLAASSIKVAVLWHE